MKEVSFRRHAQAGGSIPKLIVARNRTNRVWDRTNPKRNPARIHRQRSHWKIRGIRVGPWTGRTPSGAASQQVTERIDICRETFTEFLAVFG
jgi:hypothetical protein